MVTKERFAQGMTVQQYVDQMSMNRERFQRALDGGLVDPSARALLERLGPPLKVLVITEDWCGTSLAYIPPVARLVKDRPDVELRIFLRDENPDLMDQYLKRGIHRAIPVFAFFDEDMNEVARFIESPPG